MGVDQAAKNIPKGKILFCVEWELERLSADQLEENPEQ